MQYNIWPALVGNYNHEYAIAPGAPGQVHTKDKSDMNYNDKMFD